MALETMAIHPVGYLIVPRFLSMIVMVPCLTVFAYLIGMVGGWMVSHTMFDISTSLYVNKTFEFLKMEHLRNGLIKSGVVLRHHQHDLLLLRLHHGRRTRRPRAEHDDRRRREPRRHHHRGRAHHGGVET